MNFNINSLVMSVLIAGFTICGYAMADVIVDPAGFAVAVEADDSIGVEITLSNNGESDIVFRIRFVEPQEEEERRNGPRRDDIDVEEIGEMRFAVMQSYYISGSLSADMLGREPLLDEENFDVFGNWDDFAEVDFEDYDAIVFNGCREPVEVYNDILERLIEYIAGGGAAYFESGDNNRALLLPGGFNNDQGRATNGATVVSPDPEDDNYSLFAEICQSTQEDFWDEGEEIEGSAWLVSNYSLGQFEDALDEGVIEWYQVLATPNGQEENAGSIAYGIGEGTIMATGGLSGYIWQWYNDEGMWGSICGEILYYLTEMSGSKWISADPQEGIVGSEDSEVVEIIFQPTGLEDGVYEMRIQIELTEPDEERDDLEQSLIEVSAVMSVNSPVANVVGSITDAATNEAIEGAVVETDRYVFTRFSDEEGHYDFENLPLNDYQFNFTATDYLPIVENIEIGEEDEVRLDVELLHSECNLDRRSINGRIPRESERAVEFNVSNDGNGDLTYSIDRRLIGDANNDPWELRNSVTVSEIVADDRVHGAVFDGEYFYISGANYFDGENGPNMIYVLNRDLELVREYEQCGESNNGFRDMAYDGELIWASGEETIFGFNPENGVQVMDFQGPYASNQALAWDGDRELIWASGITSQRIVGFNRDGEEVASVPRNNLRIYGLAYYPEDPDEHPLYVFHSPGDQLSQIYKLNPDIEDGDAIFVCELEFEDGGTPSGAFITNSYDFYSWVFMGSTNDGRDDRINILQLAARKDWMQVEPVEGVIGANENQDFSLRLSSHGFPEVLLEGELVFVHDGVGGETVLPLSLDILRLLKN